MGQRWMAVASVLSLSLLLLGGCGEDDAPEGPSFRVRLNNELWTAGRLAALYDEATGRTTLTARREADAQPIFLSFEGGPGTVDTFRIQPGFPNASFRYGRFIATAADEAAITLAVTHYTEDQLEGQFAGTVVYEGDSLSIAGGQFQTGSIELP